MLNEKSRIREIATVFLRHGIKDGFRRRDSARELREALEELGPTFVKLGQILATRPDLIPENFIMELTKLHDDVRPVPFVQIRGVIEKELTGSIEELFLEFQKEPLAAASTAQIHRATLPGGEHVVVKVQRPGIRETMQRDLQLLKRLARLTKFTPNIAVLNPQEAIDELIISTNLELDYLNEANNIQQFSENNQEVQFLRVPKVYSQYTTSKVLVMEYLEGVRLDDLEYLETEGYDREDIANKLVHNYLKQLLEDGFFHADPHPGNIHIVDTKIAFLDFGLVGVLSDSLREKFQELLMGIALQDMELMTHSVMGIGLWRGKVNAKKLARDLEEVYSDYINLPLEKINLAELMERILKTARVNNIAMPREMTMLMRGLVTLEGVVAKLAPDLSIIELAIPYARRLFFENWDPKEDLARGLRGVFRLSRSAIKLPEKLLTLVDNALSGKLKFEMEHTNLDRAIAELSKMANRIVFSLIISALIIGSSMLANANIGPKIYGIPVFGAIGFLGAAVMGLWLLISILRSGRI
jgi:ubiquinone biosynthesis protein